MQGAGDPVVFRYNLAVTVERCGVRSDRDVFVDGFYSADTLVKWSSLGCLLVEVPAVLGAVLGVAAGGDTLVGFFGR